MAADCVEGAKSGASATVNNGMLVESTAGAKSGRSNVYFGVSELCSQCCMHGCLLSGKLCSEHGSPACSICIPCSTDGGGGK